MTGTAASPLQRAYGSWNRFWFSEGNSFGIGLFRILFACCLWREVAAAQARNGFAVAGGFHLPYASFIPTVPERVYDWLHLVQYPLVLWLGIGFFSRYAAGALFALNGYFLFADQMNFSNDAYFFVLILLILPVAPLDDALSVRRWLGRGGGSRRDSQPYLGTWAPLTAQRLIQVQLSIVYVWSAIHLVRGHFLSGGVFTGAIPKALFEGLSGDVLRVFLSRESFASFREFTNEAPWFVVLLVLATAAQLFLAIALWSRPLRPYAILIGLGLHASIALVMDIRAFSLVALAIYPLFLAPETLPRWLALQFGDADAEGRRIAPETATGV